MHFDTDLSVAFARFAAPARNVETEPSRLVPAPFRVLRHGKNIAYLIKNLRIGCRIGTGRPADRTLVNGHDTFDFIDIDNPLHFPRLINLYAAVHGYMLIQRINHKGAFAGSGNARHTRKQT